MSKDAITEKIERDRVIPYIKGIESKILDGGFMPIINTEEQRNLYMTYYKNKYEQTPIQAKETKILYQTLYFILSQIN